jgi:hypothetical protein
MLNKSMHNSKMLNTSIHHGGAPRLVLAQPLVG